MGEFRILITTVGGLTSPDIIQSIKKNGKEDIYLLGVDPFEFAVGRCFVDCFQIVPDSTKDEDGFIKAINGLVKQYSIDLVLPCGNEDNLALAKRRREISAKIMVGNYDDLIKAYDKAAVYIAIKDNLPQFAPKFYLVNNYSDFMEAVYKLGYPEKKAVVKPRFGRGGRGVYILSGKLDYDTVFKSKPIGEYPLEFFKKILKEKDEFEELIIMEFLTKPFYSVYSLCQDGSNIVSLTHTREWGNASQTFRGQVYYDANIEHLASKTIKIFNLSYTNNMELGTSRTTGQIVLYDLNPRIAASCAIDRYIGLNFPYEAVKIARGERVLVNKDSFPGGKRFLRYFDQVWI